MDVMNQIMEQKEAEISATQLQELDGEGIAMAEGKRFTFDIPVNQQTADPLR